jgi:pimeloyl-ACP methyl ester carboxylesterase
MPPLDAPAVLLWGGAMAGPGGLGQVAAALAASFRILGPGQGTRGLEEALDRAGVQRAALIGFSEGAAAALHFAATHPDKVDGVVTCAGYPETDPHLQAKLLAMRGAHRAGGLGHALDVALPWLWGPHSIASETGAIAAWRGAFESAGGAALEDGLDGALRASTGDLSSLDRPVLVCVGDQDSLTPLRYSHQLVEACPGALLATVERCGHLVSREQPEAFVRLARGFINRLHHPVRSAFA